jgi:hypothetical protein
MPGNIYKRPMFRKGGPAEGGITSGLQSSRLGFSTGKSTKERLLEAVGTRPAKQNFNDFLINFGLDIASRPSAGPGFGGFLTTAAQSAQEPYKQFAANRTGEQDLLRKIALEAETLDIGQEQALALQKEKNRSVTNASPYYKKAKEAFELGAINPSTGVPFKSIEEAFSLYSLGTGDEARASITDRIANLTTAYVNQGDDYDIGKNKATWDIVIKDKLTESVTDGLVGGKLPTNETQRNKLLKKQSSIGKYFYDLKDGKVKKFNGIIEKGGQKGYDWTEVDQETFEDIIPTGEEIIEKEKVIGTSESPTKLSRAEAEVEAEARGYVLIPPASGRGDSSKFRRENPNAISIVELQAIIDKENMAETYANVKNKERIR